MEIKDMSFVEFNKKLLDMEFTKEQLENYGKYISTIKNKKFDDLKIGDIVKCKKLSELLK